MKDKIEIVLGDITKIKVDAIVNAANTTLLGGGGVDGAIHRVGGEAILSECMQIKNKQGGCPVGEAVITSAGKLPARYVIHAVGPIWHGGKQQEPELLANAYRNSLLLAVKHQIKTLSFPNISTGVYNFPKTLAVDIAWQTVNQFLAQQDALQKVYFVCFDAENYELYIAKTKK